MNRRIFVNGVAVGLLFILGETKLAFSEEAKMPVKESIVSNQTEVPTDNSIETISLNGSITRSTCPHTCASRGIPKESCKEWKSNMYNDKCYVQDLRLPSDAIPMGGEKAKKEK